MYTYLDHERDHTMLSSPNSAAQARQEKEVDEEKRRFHLHHARSGSDILHKKHGMYSIVCAVETVLFVRVLRFVKHYIKIWVLSHFYYTTSCSLNELFF